MTGTFRIKRIYEPVADHDGRRVLVDRLWPRGVSRDGAALDFWLKDIAPTSALRRWFGHDAAHFGEFRTRYRDELAANPQAVGELLALADSHDVTLLFAAHDKNINHVQVLAEFLEDQGYRFDRSAPAKL